MAVVILAAMIGHRFLGRGHRSGFEGVKSGWLTPPSMVGILAYSLVIAIGLVLVAVEASRTERSMRNRIVHQESSPFGPGSVLGRWWHSFRLVLLLAIGPALLALALATAHKTPEFKPEFTRNATGVQVVTSYVLVDPNIPYAGEVRRAERLMIAAVLLLTILIHGGAAVSLGLGLGLVPTTWWKRRPMVIAAGITVLAFFVLPIFLTFFVDRARLNTAMWSFVMASDSPARPARHPLVVRPERDPLVRDALERRTWHFRRHVDMLGNLGQQRRLNIVSNSKLTLGTSADHSQWRERSGLLGNKT